MHDNEKIVRAWVRDEIRTHDLELTPGNALLKYRESRFLAACITVFLMFFIGSVSACWSYGEDRSLQKATLEAAKPRQLSPAETCAAACEGRMHEYQAGAATHSCTCFNEAVDGGVP